MTKTIPAIRVESIALSTGVTIEYASQGTPSEAPPVVFLHGVTDSWRSFEGVLALLPEEIRAFALSQRGHGNSSRPSAGYRYEDMARDVRAFLAALRIPRAVIVGHSMGAMVALDFASRYPSLTAGSVVMAGWPTLRGVAPVKEFAEASILGLTDPIDPAFIREFQMSTVANEVPADVIETAVSESGKAPAHVWRSAFQGFLAEDPADIRRIAAPTLVVWGDRDAYAGLADQRALLKAIPGSRFILYEGAGHAFHWEDPARFAADLLLFRSEQVLGGGTSAMLRHRTG